VKSRGLCQTGLTGCTRQAALERQDLSGMYIAHLEPESEKVIVIVVVSMLSAGSLLQLLPSQQVNLSNLKTIPAICMLHLPGAFISSMAVALDQSDADTWAPTGVSLVAIAMGLNLLELLPFRLPSLDVDVRTLQVPPLLQVGS